MVANYKNAVVFFPSNPTGIDESILKVQQTLASNVGWMERVFGRCTAQRGKVEINDKSRKYDVIFPEVYQANDEPMTAMPNDSFKSYCFFNVHDPAKIIDYDSADLQTNIVRDVSIIFWVNLKKIGFNYGHRYNSNLLVDVFSALKKQYVFKPTQAFEHYDQVFDEFTITEEYKHFMKLPYSAFRIRGEISYIETTENVCN